MGYGVYWDWGHGRWQGYGVPAECDYPGCTAEIDLGLGYKCEEYTEFQPVYKHGELHHEVEIEHEGCGLFFCGEHEGHEHHGDRGPDGEWIRPKPNGVKWIEHVLTDDSWKPWRLENPANARNYATQLGWGYSPLAGVPVIDSWYAPRGNFYLIENKIIGHPFDTLMLLQPKDSIERLDLVLDTINRLIDYMGDRALAKLATPEEETSHDQ